MISLTNTDANLILTVYDPNPIYKHCLEHGLPTDFYGKASRFMTSLGREPGRGWVIMAYQDLTQLQSGTGALGGTQLEDRFSLAFDDGGGTDGTNTVGGACSKITIYELFIVHAEAITPGNLTDPLCMYLVELADCRWLAQNPFFANSGIRESIHYNVRAPSASQTYYSDSLESGVPYQWQDVLNDLWVQLNLPSFGSSAPTIPATAVPCLGPEGLRFIGVSVWEAINDVMFRIGCAIAVDPTATTSASRFTVVQIGALGTEVPYTCPASSSSSGSAGSSSSASSSSSVTPTPCNAGSLANAIVTYQPQILFDTNPFESMRTKVPASVNVTFHRFYMHYGQEATTAVDGNQWSTKPTHVENVVDPTGTLGVEPTSVITIWDDLSAIVDHDFTTIVNLVDIQERALERAADYYRFAKISRMHKIYMGIICDPWFFPGAQIAGTVWGDDGTGYKTEIMQIQPPLWPGRDGKWQHAPERTIQRLHTPDLGRATFPLYPQVDQFVQINNMNQNPDGTYDASLVILDPTTNTIVVRENVWLSDMNNL